MKNLFVINASFFVFAFVQCERTLKQKRLESLCSGTNLFQGGINFLLQLNCVVTYIDLRLTFVYSRLIVTCVSLLELLPWISVSCSREQNSIDRGIKCEEGVALEIEEIIQFSKSYIFSNCSTGPILCRCTFGEQVEI